MFDASVLTRLVGMQGALRPTIRSESTRIIRALEQAIDAVDVLVVGHESGVLQLESGDAKVFDLDHRAVVIAFVLDGEDVQLEGSLELRTRNTPYQMVLHPVVTPHVLQRRKWVRVPTKVAVQLTPADSEPGSEQWLATTTRDLSPGGACVSTVGDFQPGQRLRIELHLATGQIEVVGEVLAVVADGTTRIRFDNVSEDDIQRLLRHHSDLEAARGYPWPRFERPGLV